MELAENQIYVRDKVITPYLSNPADAQKLIVWLIRNDTTTQTKQGTRAYIHDLATDQIDSWDDDYRLKSCSKWETLWRENRVIVAQDIVDEGYSEGQAKRVFANVKNRFPDPESAVQAYRDKNGDTMYKLKKPVAKPDIPVIALADRVTDYLRTHVWEDYTCHQISQALDVDNRLLYIVLMQLTSDRTSKIIKTVTPTPATEKKPAGTKTLFRFYPYELIGGKPHATDMQLNVFIREYLKLSDWNVTEIYTKARWFFNGIRRTNVVQALGNLEKRNKVSWQRGSKNSRHYKLIPVSS